MKITDLMAYCAGTLDIGRCSTPWNPVVLQLYLQNSSTPRKSVKDKINQNKKTEEEYDPAKDPYAVPGRDYQCQPPRKDV